MRVRRRAHVDHLHGRVREQRVVIGVDVRDAERRRHRFGARAVDVADGNELRTVGCRIAGQMCFLGPRVRAEDADAETLAHGSVFPADATNASSSL